MKPTSTSCTSRCGPQSACRKKRAGNWEWSSPRRGTSFAARFDPNARKLFRNFARLGQAVRLRSLAWVHAPHADTRVAARGGGIERLVPVPGLLAPLARAAWSIRLCRRAQVPAEQLEQRCEDLCRT